MFDLHIILMAFNASGLAESYKATDYNQTFQEGSSGFTDKSEVQQSIALLI